ncbi:MAG: hypothetical protein SWZ49_00215 [Cyanobacteriota bacterium]|nr:hypothetical protein [Cyanobacteriota bacterium]
MSAVKEESRVIIDEGRGTQNSCSQVLPGNTFHEALTRGIAGGRSLKKWVLSRRLGTSD